MRKLLKIAQAVEIRFKFGTFGTIVISLNILHIYRAVQGNRRLLEKKGLVLPSPSSFPLVGVLSQEIGTQSKISMKEVISPLGVESILNDLMDISHSYLGNRAEVVCYCLRNCFLAVQFPSA